MVDGTNEAPFRGIVAPEDTNRAIAILIKLSGKLDSGAIELDGLRVFQVLDQLFQFRLSDRHGIRRRFQRKTSPSKEFGLIIGKHFIDGIAIEIFIDLEAVRVTVEFQASAKGGSGAGDGIDDGIALIGKNTNERFQEIDGLLSRMDARHIFAVSAPMEPIKNHIAVVVEFRKFIAVKNDGLFNGAEDFHVGFESLRGIIFDEIERVRVVESVLDAVLND